jgi:hypothetical protein
MKKTSVVDGLQFAGNSVDRIGAAGREPPSLTLGLEPVRLGRSPKRAEGGAAGFCALL